MLLPRRQLQMPFQKGKYKSKIPIKDLESIKSYTKSTYNQKKTLNLRNIYTFFWPKRAAKESTPCFISPSMSGISYKNQIQSFYIISPKA